MSSELLLEIDRYFEKQLGKTWSYVRFDVLNGIQNPSSIDFLYTHSKSVSSFSVTKLVLLIKYSIRFLLSLRKLKKRHIFLIPRDYWQPTFNSYFLFEKVLRELSSDDFCVIEIPSGENYHLSPFRPAISAMPRPARIEGKRNSSISDVRDYDFCSREHRLKQVGLPSRDGDDHVGDGRKPSSLVPLYQIKRYTKGGA